MLMMHLCVAHIWHLSLQAHYVVLLGRRELQMLLQDGFRMLLCNAVAMLEVLETRSSSLAAAARLFGTVGFGRPHWSVCVTVTVTASMLHVC